VTHGVSFRRETLAAARQRAKEEGMSLSTYIGALVERDALARASLRVALPDTVRLAQLERQVEELKAHYGAKETQQPDKADLIAEALAKLLSRQDKG